LRRAEAGDQAGVDFVSLGTGQLTLGEGLNAGRVDLADGVAGVVEKDRQLLAVGARGF
jgi:hypothetical protein